MSTEERDTEFVNNFLMHYASPYYDPVKAKEYYERTKQLKGKRSTSGMGEERRNAWNYTKTQINDAKKAESKQASEDRKAVTKQSAEQRKAESDSHRQAQIARIEKLRETAEATRARIEEKLSDKLAKLQEATAIPEGASPKLRAFLMKQRARQSESARKSAGDDLKKIAPELKSALEKVRKDYEESTKALRAKHDTDRKALRAKFDSEKKARNDKYEQTLDREFEGIRDNVKDAPTARGSKKT